MQSAAIEQSIGITTFLTPFSGIQGTLRRIPEDFIVNEKAHIPKPDPQGIYTIAWIKSKNWDTHLLVRKLSKQLQMSNKRISFAGTKDKRAITTQLMSFADVQPQELETLHIKDVEITPLHTTQTPVLLGKLHGNHFTITIRNIPSHITSKQINAYTQFFTKTPVFPNYFGIQRFGGIRPITHIVGYHIIRGEIQQAVMTYLAKAYPEESTEIAEIRTSLSQTHDFAAALAAFPLHLHFERAMLSVLVHKPDDFVRALQALPKNLLLMFINAYQSYLFNKIISMRITNSLPIDHAIPGDIIIPVSFSQRDTELITATSQNLEKVNHQITKHHAVVSGILLGHSSQYAQGEMGEIEQKIIEQEEVDPRSFFIPEIPYLSSSGTRRGIHSWIQDLTVHYQGDSPPKNKQTVTLSFYLDKGCYATSFLREWMKASDIRAY